MFGPSDFAIDTDTFLVTQDAASPWRRRLSHSGLTMRLVSPKEFVESFTGRSPSLIFFDIRCDSAERCRFREALDRRGGDSSTLIALIPSHAGAVERVDLDAAHELGAAEILLSESQPATIAARVQFALLKGAGVVSALVPQAAEASPLAEASWHRRGGFGALLVGHEGMRERLTRTLATVGGEVQVAVIFIDIDRFKQIASRYGRHGAERVLEWTAERLARAVAAATDQDPQQTGSGTGSLVRPAAFRLMGDQYVVVYPGLARRRQIDDVVQRLLRAIATPLEVDGTSLYLSASAGVALAPRDAREADSLLRAAHTALTHAKQRASSSYAYYTPQLAASQAQRLEVEHRLRQALQAGELTMHYQPQALAASREIVGVEALVRWNHPELGLVSPESFIGVAEEVGITAELGRWALRTAIGEIGALERTGLPPLRLAINLSADMFATLGGKELVEFTLETLNAAGLPADRLTLEITERAIVEDGGTVLAAILRMKSHGVRFALDDFGTGYSSLSHLKSLPIDEIKIDRSFIVGGDVEDVAVLRAIISMAKTLGMTIVAEGVETAEQAARLAEEGCDLFQGYICAPPVPGNELAEALSTRAVAVG